MVVVGALVALWDYRDVPRETAHFYQRRRYGAPNRKAIEISRHSTIAGNARQQKRRCDARGLLKARSSGNPGMGNTAPGRRRMT
jgi:hypothetical protein